MAEDITFIVDEGYSLGDFEAQVPSDWTTDISCGVLYLQSQIDGRLYMNIYDPSKDRDSEDDLSSLRSTPGFPDLLSPQFFDARFSRGKEVINLIIALSNSPRIWVDLGRRQIHFGPSLAAEASVQPKRFFDF